MATIRSILWIGSGRGLAASGVAEAPELDVTWVPDLAEAAKQHARTAKRPTHGSRSLMTVGPAVSGSRFGCPDCLRTSRSPAVALHKGYSQCDASAARQTS